MFKNKLHTALWLMMATIAVIIFFQLFWLQKNYQEEKQALEKQTDILFRETIFSMQARQLQNSDSLNIIYKAGAPGNIIGISNALQKTVKDDPAIFIEQQANKESKDSGHKKSLQSVFITVHDSMRFTGHDTQRMAMYTNREIKGGRLFNLLLQVDSLQDTIHLNELSAKLDSAFRNAGYTIPFSIQKQQKDTGNFSKNVIQFDLQENQVPVGFSHPYVLQLTLGNTVPYLLKEMMLPISFSVFLIAVTILSFLFLYRNLLLQNKLNDLKNNFISNITHELKTPVATVGVAIEALKNFNASGSTEKTKEYLDISEHELERLSMLIDKVLKLSLFEQKEIELKKEPVDLKKLTEESIASMQLLLEKYHASVHIQSEGDVCMQGDIFHLQGVISNLIDNALKYSSTNPSITIALKESVDTIIFTINDNGIGIAPEYKNKIFEKFFRVPTGNTHDAKGYGLGLSYVRQVVEKHKGNIRMESKPGSGSTFIIVLPKLKV